MQIDIKRIGARTNANHFTDLEFAVKHHRAGLHIRQRFGAQADRGGWQIAQAVFNRFFQVGIQRVAFFHFPLGTGQNTYAAAEPLAGAGAKELPAIKSNFDIHAAVHHELTVTLHQVTMLWFNSNGK